MGDCDRCDGHAPMGCDYCGLAAEGWALATEIGLGNDWDDFGYGD